MNIPFPQTDLMPEYNEYASYARDALMREISKQKQSAITRAQGLGVTGSGVTEYPQMEINKQLTNALKDLYGGISKEQAGTKINRANVTQGQDWREEMNNIQNSEVLKRMSIQFEQQKELMNMQKKIQEDMQKESFNQNLMGMGIGALASPILGVGSSAIKAGIGSMLGLGTSKKDVSNTAQLLGINKTITGKDGIESINPMYEPFIESYEGNLGFKGLFNQDFNGKEALPSGLGASIIGNPSSGDKMKLLSMYGNRGFAGMGTGGTNTNALGGMYGNILNNNYNQKNWIKDVMGSTFY